MLKSEKALRVFFKAIGLVIVHTTKDFKRLKKNTMKCDLRCCNFVKT